MEYNFIYLISSDFIAAFFIISFERKAETEKFKQKGLPRTERNYSYIDTYRQAYKNAIEPTKQLRHLHLLQNAEAERDFYVTPLKHLNNLVQLDPTPNIDLKEARCEIYKISVSFEPKCELYMSFKYIYI